MKRVPTFSELPKVIELQPVHSIYIPRDDNCFDIFYKYFYYYFCCGFRAEK